MKSLVIVVLTCSIIDFSSIATASPVVPGLFSKHPLTERQVGELLIQELRCLACHRQKNADFAGQSAPDLSYVGARISPDYLQRFLASPSSTRAGTTMPDLLADENDDQRTTIAESLTHFLIAQSSQSFARQKVEAKEVSTGKALFHSIGCVACHSPRNDQEKETITKGVIQLTHVSGKYSLESLSSFLYQPTSVRPSGRMPDMKLKPLEARSIASYLIGKADAKIEMFRPKKELVALGGRHFQRLRCASCHKLGGTPTPKPIGSFDRSDFTQGCLSLKPGKSPRFSLSESQTKAIRAALARNLPPLKEKEQLALTLTRFNCIGCHVRDNYGGVAAQLNPHFQSSEKELGDDGRIPPPLTLVGAKLKKLTLKKVLFDGDSVRSYMATRMPQFGKANLAHLPDLFTKLDHVKKINFELPKVGRKTQKERDREKEMRSAGHTLVGDKGLNCIACHSFNGQSSGKQCIDLLTFPERLQPGWFYHFVRNPNIFRPRTVMPTAWPEGQALFKTILNGDTDRQIEAIWHYLSLGTSARIPSGVRVPPTLLKVTDEVRTYRGRSSVAGYRGIAVGFPNQLNYAFNAETGTLTAIWKGDFLHVYRRGQGSGRFNPAGRHISLAQDLSFYRLADLKTPWPLRPVMTNRTPVNPNPLYPKNLGYQFKGYYMDDELIPTFMYRSGNIKIEDRSTTKVTRQKFRLERTLTFDSPGDQTIWFRALTGKIRAESKRQFQTPHLKLDIPALPTVLRPIKPSSKSSELLLKITLPKGKSTQKLTYELLQ